MVSKQEREILSVVGDTYHILITGKQSAEFFSYEFNIPPHGIACPYSHADFHESFYVIDREVDRVMKLASFYLVISAGLESFFKE